MSNTTIQAKLSDIQSNLKVPKSQYNSFGKYYYRNCEDILEAVKTLAKEQGCVITISDTIELIGDRYYVLAIATIKSAEGEISASAYAREDESKKGMDSAQLTGATSSYARKYALNGLFAIDDTKDPDNFGEKPKVNVTAPTSDDKPWLDEKTYQTMLTWIQSGKGQAVRDRINSYKMKKTYSDGLNQAFTDYVTET